MDRDRRKFLKDAALGVAALGGTASVGCGDGEGPGQGQQAALSPSTVSPEQANLLRLAMARTDLPLGVWDDALALAQLGQDVFDDPAVASRFREDPSAYLRSIHLGHVRLDTGAIETRLALALGDPELRGHIANGNYGRFIDALGQRGLLDGSVGSPLAVRIAGELTKSLGLSAGTELVTVFAAAALLVLVAVTYITVAYTVAAGMVAAVWMGAVLRFVAIQPQSRSAVLRHAPGLGLASAMGGINAGQLAAEAYIESTVDSAARLLESSPTFTERSTMDGQALRSLIRDTLCLQLALPPPS
jgi:hypothetical protein